MQGIRITPHPILMRFNSHTYMYDTSQCECEKPLLQLVSIHAPAWGATGSYDCSGYASSVSIHAPAWGATLVTVSHINGMDWFQFTRPRGARLTLFPKLDYFIGFNSRARVGRDSTTFRPFMSCTKFQLTRPRGARLKVTSLLMVLYSFQFTRPRGARLALKIYLRFAIGFNSRARVGRDAYQQAFLQWLDVSIHAPAWGATKQCRGKRHGQSVSIHAPAWGATS